MAAIFDIGAQYQGALVLGFSKNPLRIYRVERLYYLRHIVCDIGVFVALFAILFQRLYYCPYGDETVVAVLAYLDMLVVVECVFARIVHIVQYGAGICQQFAETRLWVAVMYILQVVCRQVEHLGCLRHHLLVIGLYGGVPVRVAKLVCHKPPHLTIYGDTRTVCPARAVYGVVLFVAAFVFYVRSVVAFAERQTYHHFEVIGFLLPEKVVEPFQVDFVHNLSLERLGRLSVKVGIGGEEGIEPRLLVKLIQQIHILGQAVLGPPFVEVSYIHIVTESYLTVGYLCIQSKEYYSVESYTVFIPKLLCIFHQFAPSERGKLTLDSVRIR